jgi:hypothetical protein
VLCVMCDVRDVCDVHDVCRHVVMINLLFCSVLHPGIADTVSMFLYLQ